MLAVIMTALGPLLKPLFEALGLGDLLYSKKTTIDQGKSETVTMGRTEVRTNRGRIARLKARHLAAVLVLLSVALVSCTSTEKERIEQRPVFIQEHVVFNAAMVTDNRSVEVIVLDDQGKPAAAGALPAPVRIDGKVIVGPVRFKEMLANEKAYAALVAQVELLDEVVRKRLLGY